MRESPWTTIVAGDIVVCREIREQGDENLQTWRNTLGRRGRKVRRSKAEIMHVNERESGGMVRLQAEAVKEHVFR